MSEHAALPPSSAEQWGHCSGAMLAQQGMPDRYLEESAEGTAAHWVFSETIINRRPLCADMLDTKAPNGVVIDDKMVDGAQVMVNEVYDTLRKHAGAPYDLRVEQRVTTGLHPDVWGTPDVSLYYPQLLYLFDYKHGHRDCPPKDNKQMACYLNGLAERYKIDGREDQHIDVVVRIVQPFCYTARGPVKTHHGKLSDWRGVWNQLAFQAEEARNNPTLSPGKHCRDCKAVGKCAATREATHDFLGYARRTYEMDKMTAHDLAVERVTLVDGLAVAAKRLSAVEADLMQRIKNGEPGSGLVLENGRDSTAWLHPAAHITAVCNLLGVDATKPGLKTPKQVLDSAPPALSAAVQSVVRANTRRVPGALKLADDSDNKVSRAFQPPKEGSTNAIT